MEQGEFIAPKNNVADFSEIRAGFTPALPKLSLIHICILSPDRGQEQDKTLELP